jgi:hypothetical protein
METLYDIILEMAKKPSHIIGFGDSDLLSFDLEKKDIKSKKKYIMMNGKLKTDELELTDGRHYNLKNIELIDRKEKPIHLNEVEELWHRYYISVPSRRSQRSRCNFKAKHETELSFIEMLGASRTYAQYELEAFILLNSIVNQFEWKIKNYFFWKSEKYPQLIVFKDWIKGGRRDVG